jgi:aminoglycoside phosphotransferase
MDLDPDHRLATIADDLDLGRPEFVVPGYLARSQVGVYADCVIKLYLLKPDVKQPQEASALRALADTGTVPRILAEGDGWVQLTRLAGTTLESIPVESRGPDLAAEVGRRLRRLHRSCSFDPETPIPGCCRVVLCHGDFSGRNIMAVDAAGTGRLEITGIIDFEKSGRDCYATDLLTYRLKTLMGLDTEWEAFIGGYHGDEPVDSSRAHLAYHLRDYVAWAMRWAVEADPPFARRVQAAATRLITD